MSAERSPHAPGDLEFVRAFVNTLDIEANADRLQSPDTWATWLTAAPHPRAPSAPPSSPDPAGDAVVSEDDLAFARALREALREGLLANHDRATLPPATARLLTEAARRARAEVRFDADGPRLAVASEGVPGVLGRVVATVAAAMTDGTWARLKACRNDACQWAFYDHSRSRTGQWCSMAICGNRAKQTRWREQRRP